jgi:hypothetical protein
MPREYPGPPHLDRLAPASSGRASRAVESRVPGSPTAELAALGKREDRVHADVERAFKAKTVDEISALIDTFGAAENRLGDDVDKLTPPADAEAANAQLADGAHELADELEATVEALSTVKTTKQALALLDQRLGDAPGTKKLDAALTALKKLGYTTSG